MHENEILVLLLGSAVLGFIFLFHTRLQQLPASRWLFAAFFVLWVSWLATVLEHFFLPNLFNILEHVGYALNGVLLFVWCWLGVVNGRAAQHD